MGSSDRSEVGIPVGTTNCLLHRRFNGHCYLRVGVRINLELYSLFLVSSDAAMFRLTGNIDLLRSPSSLIYSLQQALQSNE